MSLFTRLRKHGRATLIVVACAFAAVLGLSVPLTLNATRIEPSEIVDTQQEAAQAAQNSVVSMAIVTSDGPCRAQKKIVPASGEALYTYFANYLECVEPGIALQPERFDMRYEYLLDAFRLVFPYTDPKQLPPGATIQIQGLPGNESIKRGNTGLEPAP